MIHYLPATLAHTTLIHYCQTSSPQIITYEYLSTTLQNLYFVDVQLSLNLGNGCNHLSLGKKEMQELNLYRFYIISCELMPLCFHNCRRIVLFAWLMIVVQLL